MNFIKKIIARLDGYQQHHSWFGFPYAVIKKYGEDQVGYQAALLTYYGFLSLFPLLLVLTTVLDIAVGHQHGVESTIINSITDYFPNLGTQLSAHVQGLHKSGVALIVGIVFTFYGARGVAGAFLHGINHVWHIPNSQRDGFPKSTFKSLLIIVVGGLGFILASLLAGYAGAVGHGFDFRFLSLAINMFVLFWLFSFLINVCLPRHVSIHDTFSGAAVAAIGLVALQSVGSYLLAQELKNLDALYSTFAIALGLLFWLYLQAQVLYYSVVIAVVRSQKLWPRAIDGANATNVDKQLRAQIAQDNF